MARRRKEDSFEDFSYSEFLTRPFRGLGRKLSRRFSDDRIRDRETNSVTSLLISPLYFLFSIAVFLVNSWAITRPVRPFLLGIPALFIVTSVAGAAWLDYFRYPNKVARTQRYYETFLTEPKRGPKIAQHFALKQMALQPDNNQAKFNVAIVWEQLGETQKAEDLMQHLCDRDFVLAHVWFARRYFGTEIANLSEEDRNAIILDHVNAALRIDPANNAARIAKADFYLLQSIKHPEDSTEHRDFLAKASDELIAVSDSETGDIVWHLPKLMKILFDLGADAQARSVYQKSRKSLMIFMRKFPGDDRVPQIWSVLIGSAIQLKDYNDAMALIEEGKRESNSPQMIALFNEMMSRMFVQQAADFKNLDDLEQFDQALDVLCKGFSQAPGNTTISDRLASFIVPTGPEKKVFTEQLEKTQSVNAPAVPHLLLGIYKSAKGDVMAAQTHWKIAETQTASYQLMLFSLLRSLGTTYHTEFENLRDVLALAIEKNPDQGLFYYLRGLHAVTSKQYQQAIPDLKQAIEMTSEPGNFEIQVQLAKCYLLLKDQPNADASMRNLQKIIARSDPNRREFLEDYLKPLYDLQ
jgi:tetratricopeptide (TPR) repeat protein